MVSIYQLPNAAHGIADHPLVNNRNPPNALSKTHATLATVPANADNPPQGDADFHSAAAAEFYRIEME
jgi:hypothetical protein